MNWNQLQYVVTIAQEKSITKAAKKLFISQPSLSVSIQSLEKELNTTIFERSHGNISLTYAGTLFYQWALSVLHSQEQLNLKLNDISKQERVLIRIGISPHRSLVMLPEILKRFFEIHPNSEIQIIEKPTYILKTLLEDNQLDFMIDIPHSDTINYHNELLAKEKIYLAVPTDYVKMIPSCSEALKEIALKDVSAYPFIMLTPNHILGSMSRKMCETASFYPNIRLTCENIETAMSLTNQQLGITFAPEILLKQREKYPHISFFSIQEFQDTRELCLVYQKNRYQSVQIITLLQIFRDTVPMLFT